MESMILNSKESLENSNSRLHAIKTLISSQKSDLSLNLLMDVFQNLILDCKYVISNNNNRHFQTLYQLYKTINDQLYKLRLNADDFFTLRVIGQGAFGQVQLVRHRETKELFAMKILNKAQMMSQEGSVFWKEERDIMSGIDSRWIVKLHFAFQNPRRLYMVMEYLPGGNLVTWMSKLDTVNETDVSFYAAEIVLAICVLHDNNLVHRDIKPDNMLLDRRGHIKLTDFGTCVRIDPVSKHIDCNRPVGTPDYISPEVLMSQSGSGGYGCEVDWWALGVMLYEIFYGDTPFYSDSLVQTYGKIMVHEQHLTFPPDEQISDRAVSLIRGLICDRSVRMGASEGAYDIKSHEFFNNRNNKWTWDNVHEFEAPYQPVLENEFDTSNFTFTEEDDSIEAFNNNDKDLTPTLFCGENLQFSGFSYGDLFNESERKNSKSNAVLTEQFIDDSVSATLMENKNLCNKVHSLGKENEDIKSKLEKVSIERKDLEIQIQNALSNLKAEVAISKKLQTDYSDLMSKHGTCQQKFLRLEEEKHKLCADLTNIQNNTSDETRRLLDTLKQQRQEYDNLDSQLSESQSEYRKSKLETVKLENDVKYLQKRCNALEQEMNQLQHSNDTSTVAIKQNIGLSQTRLSLELKELRQDYDEKWKELQQQMMENETLTKLVTTLEKENETIKKTLAKSEEQLTNYTTNITNLNHLIKDKNFIIENMITKTQDFERQLNDSKKEEKLLNSKLLRLTKLKSDEKQKFDNDIEEQRKKLNSIIANKIVEIQQLTKHVEIITQENGSIKSELQLEKAKCSGLVEKINDILTGKSTTAREMMLAEEMKSGKVDKRSGRYYNQLLKENKRLQSLFNQMEKDSVRKEKELKTQLETVLREKEHMEAENVSLKNNVNYYENMGISEHGANRTSVMTYSSHGSYDSGFPSDLIKTTSTPIRNSIQHSKPPPFHLPSTSISPMSSMNSQSIKLRNDKDKNDDKLDLTVCQNKMKTLDNSRLSITESLSADIPCPDGQLDVSVKVKGKKMWWEKRFVKFDNQNLYFYTQSLETCILKLPLSSLLFVRRASNADIIHAKKGEIPRIFQIFYDKNRTLYTEIMLKQSLSGSNCSINTLGSSKSSGKESVVNDLTDSMANDFVHKIGPRRGSVAKFLPLFGSKTKSKADRDELTMNSIGHGAVLLKGHIYEPCSADHKKSCDMCQTSLLPPPPQPPLFSSQLTHTSSVVTTSNPSTINRDLRVIIDTGVRLMSTSRTVDLLSSTVDPHKCYQCYHCNMTVHGTDLNEKMTTCKESVAIQVCRATSEQQLSDWILSLTAVIKSHQAANTLISSPSISRADFKFRSATLG